MHQELYSSSAIAVLERIPKPILSNLYKLKYYLSPDGRQYLWGSIRNQFVYTTNNPYGIPEPRINLTVFRFWLCRAYWQYVFTRLLQTVGLWHAEKQLQTSQHRYLTGIPDSLAGFGHQLSNWNAAQIYAQQYHLTFAHQPLAGNGGAKWEAFLALSQGEVLYSQLIQDPTIQRVKLPRLRWMAPDPVGQRVIQGIIHCAYPGGNVLFELARDCTAPNVYDHTPTSEILRKKYWQARAKMPVDYFLPTDGLNVACHVRRGDILTMSQDNQNFKSRWLDNSFFIALIQKIKALIHNQKIYTHVFSQGAIEHFQEFEQLDSVIYHLDEDQYHSFHGMILADILIVSPSSFSFKAGMISTGIKIARYPWWHEIPNNDEWLRCDADGNFSSAPLIARYANSALTNGCYE